MDILRAVARSIENLLVWASKRNETSKLLPEARLAGTQHGHIRLGNKGDVIENGFVRLSSRTHDISLAGNHVPDLQRVTDDINDAVQAVWPKRHQIRYSQAYVLLLSWEDDDLGVKKEIPDLRHAFEKRYGFEVEEYRIPSEKPIKHVQQRMNKLLELDGKDKLFVVYYAGHARQGMQSNEGSIWVPNRIDRSIAIPSGGVQSLLEEADADVLLLYDCCHSASVPICHLSSAKRGVTEAISACGFGDIAAEVDDHSFTKALTQVLVLASSQTSFTVGELHARVLSHLKCWVAPLARDLDGNHTGRLEPQRRKTPIYTILSETKPRRSIVLGPLLSSEKQFSGSDGNSIGSSVESEISTPLPSSIESLSNNREATFTERDKCAQVLVIARVDHLDLDTGEWADWIRAMPSDGKEVHVEGRWDSFSTLLLLRMPVAVWNMLRDSAAYDFVGFVTSENCAFEEWRLDTARSSIRCAGEPHPILVCQSCSSKELECDGMTPCSQCAATMAECVPSKIRVREYLEMRKQSGSKETKSNTELSASSEVGSHTAKQSFEKGEMTEPEPLPNADSMEDVIANDNVRHSETSDTSRGEPWPAALLESTKSATSDNLILGKSPKEPVSSGPGEIYSFHVLVAVRLSKDEVEVHGWRKCLIHHLPLDAKDIKIEAVYDGFSTLVLARIPITLWRCLPQDSACNFVGFVTENKDWAEPSSITAKDGCDVSLEQALVKPTDRNEAAAKGPPLPADRVIHELEYRSETEPTLLSSLTLHNEEESLNLNPIQRFLQEVRSEADGGYGKIPGHELAALNEERETTKAPASSSQDLSTPSKVSETLTTRAPPTARHEPLDVFNIPWQKSSLLPPSSQYGGSTAWDGASSHDPANMGMQETIISDSSLRPYIMYLQHEISIQKDALYSLRTEHNKFLARLSPSQTQLSSLERERSVSETGVLKMTEDSLSHGLEKGIEGLREATVPEGLERDEVSRIPEQINSAGDSKVSTGALRQRVDRASNIEDFLPQTMDSKADELPETETRGVFDERMSLEAGNMSSKAPEQTQNDPRDNKAGSRQPLERVEEEPTHGFRTNHAHKSSSSKKHRSSHKSLIVGRSANARDHQAKTEAFTTWTCHRCIDVEGIPQSWGMSTKLNPKCPNCSHTRCFQCKVEEHDY